MRPVPSTLSRLASSFAISLFMAGFYFTFLSAAIRPGGHGANKVETLPTIDFVRLKRDSQVETLQRRKPPPPPPPQQPPPPPQLRVATAAADHGAAAFDAPSLGLGVNVSGGPAIGKLGGAGAFDTGLIPLQRFPPTYPADAYRAGITGYVVVEFVVKPDGSVSSVKVVDAKPRRGLFDAAATKAARRWKFKPRTVNGIPVEQRGTQRIEFELQQ